MRHKITWQVFLWLVLLVFTTVGCQPVARDTNKPGNSTTADASGQGDLARQIRNLKTLGAAWHSYQDQHRKGPANWEELIAFGQKNSALTELRDSGCVVTGWGLRFADVKIGISNFVLAYSPEAKQDKGPVLLMDGFVREMSVDELQEALEIQQNIGGGQ